MPIQALFIKTKNCHNEWKWEPDHGPSKSFLKLWWTRSNSQKYVGMLIRVGKAMEIYSLAGENIVQTQMRIVKELLTLWENGLEGQIV